MARCGSEVKGSLDNLRNGEVSFIKTDQGLPGEVVSAMFEDHSGRLWLGVDEKLMLYERGKFLEVTKPDGSPLALGGHVVAVTEDLDQNIWAMAYTIPRHLYRIRDQKVREEVPLTKLEYASWLVSDNEGGIWLGAHSNNTIAHYRAGQLQLISLPEGKTLTIVNYLHAESAQSVWVATSNGLFRWKDGQVKDLGMKNGLPCSLIFSLLTDDFGSLWMYTSCGLVRISRSDLEKWWEHPESPVAMTSFAASEGARPGNASTQPKASKSIDGRLWFANGLSVQMIDPSRLHTNDIPPLVQIESVKADRTNYLPAENLRLPALTSDLEIDYTALSFSVPQKVQFRYKLSGHDVDWQEPGTRRAAFYSDLGPGTYSFHVIACNNDGVWNEWGASLNFIIPPAWHQTTWFRLACLLAALLFLFCLYRLRVRQIARVISLRFDERLDERTRMARELHDTFLQTIQACTMVADDALDQTSDPERLRRTMQKLSKWLHQAMREGRDALNSLRSSTTETNDLAEALRRATKNGLIQSPLTVDFSVVGTSKEMHPLVRDEVYRIGYEAIRNSVVHSKASRLQVELRYEQDLSLRVKDNGVGIDCVVLSQGKNEHFGLQGMRDVPLALARGSRSSAQQRAGRKLLLRFRDRLCSENQDEARAQRMSPAKGQRRKGRKSNETRQRFASLRLCGRHSHT